MLSCVKLLLIGGNSPIDTDALKTLCLVICTIEDKRATQRVKKTKRATDANGHSESTKATGWKQAINQLSVTYPDRLANNL